jgi:hypothetical protein
MNAHARFVAVDAAEERATTARPLLIGLTGPSGSGKTYSALRLATGIQSVVGGEIFVVDTEQRRSLDYAGDFAFKHVDFRAPFGSLDYLEALRFCKMQGAGVVVIDSCSHEHDGPGGLLEQHEAELDRMAGNDRGKRDRMGMLAWQKPKAGRRKLITAITTELNMPTIFCFRARRTTKPNPGKQPIDMGFSSIGADEWLFELSLNALFLPGSDGVPIWDSELPGERLAIKLPKQFRGLSEQRIQFTEKVGRKLALWAAPGGNTAPVKTERFEASDAGPSQRESFEEGPSGTDRGESSTTTDALTEALGHLSRRTRIEDVQSLQADWLPRLDPSDQDRWNVECAEKIAELKGGE